MSNPGALNYLAKAILEAMRGRRGLFLLLVYVLYRKFTSVVLSLRPRSGESLRSYLGRTVLLLPPASNTFSKEINKQLVDMRKRAKKIYDEFGFLNIQIPEDGLKISELKQIVDKMAEVPQRHCEKTFMSGGIYSFSYWQNNGAKSEEAKGDEGESIDVPTIPETPEDYTKLAMKLKNIFTYSFEVSYLWNSLHGTEFGVGDFLTYQCVRMVADMYGGKPDEVMGLVTSGGTESIMTAVRAYRDWGIANRGLAVGEGVILVAHSVHAAFMKGCMAYNLHCEMLPVDEYDQIDLNAVREAAERIGNRLVAIVGSTPSYPLGTIDDIKGLAAIAKANGVGMHVDSCLGGFIINFIDTVDTNFLALPGVTSLSCDTHKNGWAPKGSSVLVMKDVPDRTFKSVNLTYYASFAIPSWSGGVYGTPNNAGSQHCTHALHAYLAMLAIGKNGYRKLANDVVSTSRRLAVIVKKFPQLHLLVGGDGRPHANVVGWQLSPELQKSWGPGAIYAIAHEMNQRGITLSAMNGFRVHFCVTSRSAGDPKFVEKFAKALDESMSATTQQSIKVLAGEASFPGDAGLYGTLDAAMEPSVAKGGVGKYIENFLFGMRGTEDAIKSYFYGIADPYITKVFGK